MVRPVPFANVIKFIYLPVVTTLALFEVAPVYVNVSYPIPVADITPVLIVT